MKETCLTKQFNLYIHPSAMAIAIMPSAWPDQSLLQLRDIQLATAYAGEGPCSARLTNPELIGKENSVNKHLQNRAHSFDKPGHWSKAVKLASLSKIGPAL